MKGKKILVVGGTRGIGQATVNLLNEKGANITVTARNKPEDFNSDIDFIQYDVNDGELNVENLPDRLDGLVYAPGTINLKPFHRISEEDFLEDFRINVLGAVKVIQKVLPLLKKSEGASIILFSTVAVRQGMPFHATTATAKAALEGLGKSLAADLAPQIRVNVIAPSITNTSLASRLLSNDDKIKASGEKHPLKRVGTPEEIASLVVFLLGDDSGWITGQVIHADGGMSSIRSL